jgi:hypothetical protein
VMYEIDKKVYDENEIGYCKQVMRSLLVFIT